MRVDRQLVLGSIVLVVLLVMSACAGNSERQAENGLAEGDVSFDLRVGAALDFSGDLADLAPSIEQAIQLGADVAHQAAEEAGIDVNIEVFTEDTQGSPSAAVEAATKLVQANEVDVLIGSASTAETIPMVESVSLPNRVVHLSLASSPLITEVEDDGYLWRTVPTDVIQVGKLVEYAAEEVGADATINTGARNDPAGTSFQGLFEELWQEGGGTIGESVLWNPEGTTFDTEMQQLAGGEPDAWMIYDFPGTWANVGPALVRTGTWDSAKTFGGDGLGYLSSDLAEDTAVGMRGLYIGSTGAPADAPFVDLYEGEADSERAYAEAHAFDAVIVSFLAAVAGGSSDGEDIRDNLQAVSGPPGDTYTFEQLSKAVEAILAGEDINYEGASGVIDFDENGDVGDAIYDVWTYAKQGEIEVVETVGVSD